jgi:hypothetical protein
MDEWKAERGERREERGARKREDAGGSVEPASEVSTGDEEQWESRARWGEMGAGEEREDWMNG